MLYVRLRDGKMHQLTALVLLIFLSLAVVAQPFPPPVLALCLLAWQRLLN